MLYSCSPGLGSTARASRASSDHENVTVDIHCHVYTPAADNAVADSEAIGPEDMFTFANQATRDVNRAQMETINSKLTSIEERLKDMDSMDIDIQALSPAPPQYYYNVEPELGLLSSQIINNRIAEIVSEYPDRFVGLGTVPMQEPRLAVTELERMINELGMRGVEICTNVAGEELSSDRFKNFFAKAEELDALIFMHPNGFSEGRRLADHYLINVIGNPLDSTVAVSHLIFGGVLDDYPDLKICVAHGGGFLPAYSGRMDHAHGARKDCRRCTEHPPTTYLKRLYFDTVVFTHHQLEYLVNLYGADHILLGTDYPYDMGMQDPVGFVESSANLDQKQKVAIAGGNAAQLLKIGTGVSHE